MLPGSPQCCLLHRSRSLVTAFRSPATAAASRRPPFRGQRSRPATSHLPGRLPCPFGLRLHCPPRFAPITAASSPEARCTSTARFDLPRLLSPLPSGTFTSLGIKAFNRVCCLPVRLPNPPDFLSLPAARSVSSLGCGSSFQVRYVSASLLFLKPLGTSFTMLPMRVLRQRFFDVKRGSFPQHLIGFISNRVTGDAPCKSMWIRHAAGKCLFSLRIHAVIRGQPQILLVGAGQESRGGRRHGSPRPSRSRCSCRCS